jgi:hypothetical protein
MPTQIERRVERRTDQSRFSILVLRPFPDSRNTSGD